MSPGIITVTAPSPLAYSSAPSCNHTLELELIHTWSVNTWTGMQVLPGCGTLLREDFVKEGLANNFMMDAIFALTAAHHAVMHKEKGNMHDSMRYDQASVDYGNRASETFRQKLQTATTRDLHLLYYFACMATVLNMLVCRQYRTALECFDVSLTLFLGSFRIAETNLDWIHQSENSIAVRAKMIETPPEFHERIPSTAATALSRLQRVCDTVRVPKDGVAEGPFASQVDAYRRAIEQTKVSFAQRANDQVPGFLFTIVALGGRELAAATAAREPVALFIHLFGFVLMDQARATGALWWVGTVARKTIDEICDVLNGSPLGQMEDVQEVMKWAKGEIALMPPPCPNARKRVGIDCS